ncbi:DUF1018 domain-containing protein [Deferribacter autotrophicus]|uniref:DUF1018 domain-containing protein n=1 Tax=Deferribacter autotrophicus TaxID=500465 RepID=A0A5A8F071_9BACT|nr:phage protein GemA/Gp16 family protein [Deferribacter autotrophicus]KAA0257192.1 DUF1018 domain-containing protein [Deferribacter autotrophicus]
MKVLKGRDGISENELRRKMIAKVHIAKKEAKICKLCGNVHFAELCTKCGSIYNREMTDFDYRTFLLYASGKTSCKNMDIFELSEVLRFFKLAGFQGAKKMNFEEAGREVKKKMLKKLKAEAERKLGAGWQNRVNRFCQERIGVSALEFCDIEQLRQVWAFLRRASKGV